MYERNIVNPPAIVVQDDSVKEIARLLQRLCDALDGAKRNYVEAAGMVMELDAKGFDFSKAKGITKSALRILRLIGGGHVLPEVVINYVGTSLGSALMTLPTKEQKRILDGGKVSYLVMTKDGKPEELAVTVNDMSGLPPDAIKLIFGNGAVRTISEQRVHLESARKAAATAATVPVENAPYVDKKRKRLICGGIELSSHDLLRYLGELSA